MTDPIDFILVGRPCAANLRSRESMVPRLARLADMSRGTRSIAAIAIFQILSFAPAAGQSTASSVRISKVAELSSETADVVPSLVPLVARFSTGEFVVSYQYAAGPQLALFDPKGKYLRLYDKVGNGPGELTRSPILALARDTLYAFESNRVSRLDRNLRLIDTRRFPLAVFSAAIVLNNGTIVSNGQANRKNTHNIVGPDLTILSKSPDSTLRANLSFGNHTASGFWVIRTNSSILEHYADNGGRVGRLPLNRAWLQSYDTTQVPRPTNAAISQIASGRVMVVTWVPDPANKVEPTGSNEILRPARVDGSKLWDTIVEVVDDVDGRLVAATRVGQWLNAVVGSPDLLFSTREVADGHVVIDVWRVDFRRPP